MQQPIPASQLVLNNEGAIYHLNLHPDQIADDIILVGDPGRVEMISSRFDTIEIPNSDPFRIPVYFNTETDIEPILTFNISDIVIEDNPCLELLADSFPNTQFIISVYNISNRNTV